MDPVRPDVRPRISVFDAWRDGWRRVLGAPLLVVFLLVGMIAGEAGPGGLKFDDVRTTYLVGSIALALILFDGGLRTRLTTCWSDSTRRSLGSGNSLRTCRTSFGLR